jgi:hypothetical protein
VGGVAASRGRLAVVLGLCVALVASCAAAAITPLDASLRAGILTPEGSDTYGLTVANGVLTAAAPATNRGANTRVAFWQGADPASTDQQTCSTWVDAHSDFQQQGAALRVRSVAGRTTAITVTNNIYFGARWAFNVHVMDSGAARPFHQIGAFDLSTVFRPGGPTTVAVPPYAWRMCARVVGDTVSFIVWPLGHPEPAWDDPRYGGSVVLPAGWHRSGNPGWYVGHLEPGTSVGFTDMSTADVGSPPATTTTTTTGSPTTTTAPTTTTTTPTATAVPIPADEGVVAPEPTTPPREPTWIPRDP